MGSVERFYEGVDEEAEEWSAFLAALHALFGGAWQVTGQIASKLQMGRVP